MAEERRQSWHRKTCETCLYRVFDTCRRFPPAGINGNAAYYPMVREGKDIPTYQFMMACAEHLDVEGRNKKNG